MSARREIQTVQVWQFLGFPAQGEEGCWPPQPPAEARQPPGELAHSLPLRRLRPGAGRVPGPVRGVPDWPGAGPLQHPHPHHQVPPGLDGQHSDWQKVHLDQLPGRGGGPEDKPDQSVQPGLQRQT